MAELSIKLPDEFPQRTRRTAAQVLGWVIDCLDSNRRPRRMAAEVVSDTLRALDAGRQALLLIHGTPSATGDTLAAGPLPVLPDRHTPLRTFSPTETPQEQSLSADLADLQKAEAYCWDEVIRMRSTGKTWGVHTLLDQIRRLKMDQVKLKDREQARGGEWIPKGEVDEMRKRISMALKPYPEAMKAVMAALAE